MPKVTKPILTGPAGESYPAPKPPPLGDGRHKRNGPDECDREDHERVATFIISMRESRNGNLWAEWDGERVSILARSACIFKKGSGWSWSINDDAVVYSKHVFADQDDAAR